MSKKYNVLSRMQVKLIRTIERPSSEGEVKPLSSLPASQIYNFAVPNIRTPLRREDYGIVEEQSARGLYKTLERTNHIFLTFEDKLPVILASVSGRSAR